MSSWNYYLTKARKNGNADDWTTYRALRNTVTFLIRRKKRDYISSLFTSSSHNNRNFWRSMKKAFLSSAKTKLGAEARELLVGEELAADPSLIAEAFSKKFAVQSECGSHSSTPCVLVTHRRSSIDSFNLQVVHPSLLKKPTHRKAVGCDQISNTFLSLAATEIANSLTALINASLLSNSIPSEWKMVKVVPIFKNGDKSSLDNYRPISIIPAASKILDTIVNSHLTEFLKHHSLLHDRQFGFRKGHSAEMLLLDTLDDWRRKLDGKKLLVWCSWT